MIQRRVLTNAIVAYLGAALEALRRELRLDDGDGGVHVRLEPVVRDARPWLQRR